MCDRWHCGSRSMAERALLARGDRGEQVERRRGLADAALLVEYGHDRHGGEEYASRQRAMARLPTWHAPPCAAGAICDDRPQEQSACPSPVAFPPPAPRQSPLAAAAAPGPAPASPARLLPQSRADRLPDLARRPLPVVARALRAAPQRLRAAGRGRRRRARDVGDRARHRRLLLEGRAHRLRQGFRRRRELPRGVGGPAAAATRRTSRPARR